MTREKLEEIIFNHDLSDEKKFKQILSELAKEREEVGKIFKQKSKRKKAKYSSYVGW